MQVKCKNCLRKNKLYYILHLPILTGVEFICRHQKNLTYFYLKFGKERLFQHTIDGNFKPGIIEYSVYMKEV